MVKSRAELHRHEWFVETEEDTQFTTHVEFTWTTKDAPERAFNTSVRHIWEATLFSCAEHFGVGVGGSTKYYTKHEPIFSTLASCCTSYLEACGTVFPLDKPRSAFVLLRRFMIMEKMSQTHVNVDPSSSSYIFRGVRPPVDPFRSHVSTSLFKGLPWFLLPVGQQCFLTLGNLFRGFLFTCCIHKSLQRSTMIPSASWTVVFHYPG
jgi:hypothetical protein